MKFVLSCNGDRLLVGSWEAEPSSDLPFEDIRAGAAPFERLRQLCGRPAMLQHAMEMRRKLLPGFGFQPLKMLGGPAVQNRELAPNSFARELVPVLRHYLGPEALENLEVLKRGYVPSSEITGYSRVLETLLRDNLGPSRHPEILDIETTKHSAPQFEQELKSALANNAQASQLLIIGGVGVGKSMFLERFYHFLLGEELKSRTS